MAEPLSEFTAEVYRTVAAEHIRALPSLYDHGQYVLCLYVSGLAVEAIFRAYRGRFDPSFDARHNLHELAKASRFVEIIPLGQIGRYSADLLEVATRWSNNLGTDR